MNEKINNKNALSQNNEEQLYFESNFKFLSILKLKNLNKAYNNHNISIIMCKIIACKNISKIKKCLNRVWNKFRLLVYCKIAQNTCLRLVKKIYNCRFMFSIFYEPCLLLWQCKKNNVDPVTCKKLQLKAVIFSYKFDVLQKIKRVRALF